MKTFITVLSAALLLGSQSFAGGQAQGQAQGQLQAQGQAQGQAQSVRVSNPEFTYGAFLNLSSSANDRCGRVAVGLVPYSAHTCNIIMEAETLFAMTAPLKGKAYAAAVALSHVASNDTTMRKTLRRMGIIE